jgi:hypothetical protein
MLVGIPLATNTSRDIAALTSQMALVEATAELMTEGAGSRTSEQVAREVETLGGRLSSAANDDYAEVDVSVVAENAERMMDLLGDARCARHFPNTRSLYTSAIGFRILSCSGKIPRFWPASDSIESSSARILTQYPRRRRLRLTPLIGKK